MGAWFKEELFLMPNWAWFAIIVGIACILIAIIIVACVKKGDSGKGGETEPVPMDEGDKERGKADKKYDFESESEDAAQPVLMAEEDRPVAESKPAETVKATADQPVKNQPAKADAKREEKSTQSAKKEKPAEKKDTKPAAQPAQKSEPKKEEKPAEKESASSEVKVYHISKRKEDKKWQVKAEGADKALRLFFTQSEAIDYAKKVAAKQEGRIVIHKEGGGFRKLNY